MRDAHGVDANPQNANAVATVARRLGLGTGNLDLTQYRGSQQHESWLVSVDRDPICWIKLQASETTAGVEREAQVLRAIEGLRLAPELLDSGIASDGRPYLVTTVLPGRPLDTLTGLDRSTLDGIIGDCATWLAAFRDVEAGRLQMPVDPDDIAGSHPDLMQLLRPAAGWWHEADALVARRLLGADFEGNVHSPAQTIHGSFDPRNLLCDEGRLSGVVDFEATRAGDGAFDVAGMACELLLAGEPRAADRWLELTLDGDGAAPVRVGGFMALRIWHRAEAGMDESPQGAAFADRIASLLLS